MPMRQTIVKTKEFFVPATQSDGTLTNLGDFPVHQLSGPTSQTARMTCKIPWDFVSLVSIDVVFVDIVTNQVTISIRTDYGANGEAYNANTGAIANLSVATIANNIVEYNINAAVASLAANDYLGVAITTRGSVLDDDVYVIGLKIRYE